MEGKGKGVLDGTSGKGLDGPRTSKQHGDGASMDRKGGGLGKQRTHTRRFDRGLTSRGPSTTALHDPRVPERTSPWHRGQSPSPPSLDRFPATDPRVVSPPSGTVGSEVEMRTVGLWVYCGIARAAYSGLRYLWYHRISFPIE